MRVPSRVGIMRSCANSTTSYVSVFCAVARVATSVSATASSLTDRIREDERVGAPNVRPHPSNVQRRVSLRRRLRRGLELHRAPELISRMRPEAVDAQTEAIRAMSVEQRLRVSESLR